MSNEGYQCAVCGITEVESDCFPDMDEECEAVRTEGAHVWGASLADRSEDDAS